MSNKWARIEELCVLKNAFSLMEMMVVLLIVAILAAATAPMVTKKMARNAGSGESPWVYTGLRNSIAFNMNGNDNSPVIIGASSLPASLESPTRLFIDSGNTASAIAFGNGNTTPIGITVDPTNGRVGISNQQVPNNSVAFGSGQTITNSPSGIVAIGSGATIEADAGNSIAIGSASTARGFGSVALGRGSLASGPRSVALGSSAPIVTQAIGSESVALGVGSSAVGNNSIAIGGAHWLADNPEVTRARASKDRSIAIGFGTYANHRRATAIGAGAQTTENNQIVLGAPGDTVHIPGNLVVDGFTDVLGSFKVQGDSYLSTRGASRVYMRAPAASGDNPIFHRVMRGNEQSTLKLESHSSSIDNIEQLHSDRRLKNVGEKYTAGLEELKKLDFFHYTYKKNEDKTPHVGVMAQDLQKVFPDAVTEGDDGYLRIRMEDMFYAVINAVKELDKKITQIVENVTSLSKKVDEQEKIIAEQQKLIEELQAQNANIEKRLAKVEKKSKKVEE